MNTAVIISGEASETDSDDESVQIPPLPITTASVQGAVIAGEDSESDNENDASVASAASALHETNLQEKEICDKSDSLLHQKLRESNIKLHQDLETFCQSVIENAKKTLNNTDQQLINSQLTLQGAVTSLKSLGSNSVMIRNKLQSLLSANFIPNIKVSK